MFSTIGYRFAFLLLCTSKSDQINVAKLVDLPLLLYSETNMSSNE